MPLATSRAKKHDAIDDALTAEDAREHADKLAKSLSIFATIPRAIAEAHIRLRGRACPDERASDADVRGALLKALSDEVLAERECKLKGTKFEPYVNARPKPAAAAAAARTGRTTTRAVVDGDRRSASRETKIIGGDRGDGSDSDSSVGVASKFVPREIEDEDEDEDEEEDEDATTSDDEEEEYSSDGDYSGEDDYADDGGNFFGRAAEEPPAPEGANPFASMGDVDFGEEARAQIEEAKRIVAERKAQASNLADALASLQTSDPVSPTPSGRVAFSDKGDDVASIAGSIAGSDFTDRFDAISIASIAATLGSDATDRVADVDGSEFDVASLASHGTHRATTDLGSDDEREAAIFESEDERDSVSSDERHGAKENAPPSPPSP